MKKRIQFTSILLGCLLTAGTVLASPQAEKLTIDKLYSPDLTSKLRTPRTCWLNNGRALMLDPRIGAAERTMELYDPETKTRKPLFPLAKFINGLKPLLGDAAPTAVTWPAGMSASGDLFLYEINGDIFLLETAGCNWKRMTETVDDEVSAALSPDGRWISYIRGNDMFAVERSTMKELRLTESTRDTLLNGPMSWVYWEELYDHSAVPYAWSPDSRSIAYLQTDDSEVSISHFVNFTPDTQGTVHQRYPKAGQVNPKVRLGIADVNTGLTTWLDCGEYEYIARFNWLPDSSAMAVQIFNRQQNDLKLLFSNRTTGQSVIVLEEKQPTWINLNSALYFFTDGKRFIWMSERDGYQHLYLYGTDGTLIRQLTKGDFMVVAAGGDTCSRNNGLVAVDEKAGWVYFTSNKDALAERQLYKIRLDGSGLVRLSTEPGIHAASFSPSLRWYLDAQDSRTDPPGLVLRKADGTRAAEISPSVKDVFARYNLGTREMLTYKADDGTDVTLMMLKPRDFDPARKYPTLIYVYGGPGSQEVMNEWGGVRWDDLMAQEGYIAVSVEVRAGLNKSKALETSIYRKAYGMQSVADILAAIRRLKDFPFIDVSRLGLWGGSGGGCTTLYTMTHCDAFKAGISLYPVSDWHYYDTIYTERYQDTPQRNPEGYKETSSVLAAKDLKGRLFIAYGTYDDNVHPQNAEAFIHQLIANGADFEMMTYPWQKHGIGARADQRHLRNRMLDFWKKNL